MKKIIFTILTICLFNLGTKAQVTVQVANTLQTTLDNYTMTNGIQGVSVAVWVEGQGMWLGTSGISHDNVNLNTEMLFGMGSITKNFTAALCLKLQEENLLNLDDPISTWLSNYDNINPNVTLRQLLGHQSGIANYTENDIFFPGAINEPNTVWTPEEILAVIDAPLFEPGAQVSYSNTNYILAGMILEAVSEMTYLELLEEEIFTPLGLDKIFVEGYEPVEGIAAHPWTQGMDLFGVPRISLGTLSWSAGCLVSTPEDLTNWWRAYFDDFLTEDSKAQARVFQPEEELNLGLGLMETEINGKKYQGHGGLTIGYSSFSAFDPNQKHIVTVMFNDTESEAENLLGALFAALDMSTSINELRKNEFGVSLFPNPVSDRIEVEINVPIYTLGKISIVNSNGVVVKNEINMEFNKGENRIPLSVDNLNSGIYFLRITGSNISTLTQRIIVTK